MAARSTGVDETVVTAKNVDFSNCDRELVQFPGAIQPHGAMLVVDEPDYTVIQASASCEALLGRPIDQVVGARIKDLFDDSAERLVDQLHRMPLDQTPVHVVREFFAGSARGVNIFAQRCDGPLILGLEAISEEAAPPNGSLYSHVCATHALAF